MTRTFVGLLLLLTVFFTGLVLGIKQNEEISETLPREIIHPPNEIVGQEAFIVSNEIDNSEYLETETPIYSIQKTASIFEKGVVGFYNLIINVMYRISSLFI